MLDEDIDQEVMAMLGEKGKRSLLILPQCGWTQIILTPLPEEEDARD